MILNPIIVMNILWDHNPPPLLLFANPDMTAVVPPPCMHGPSGTIELAQREFWCKPELWEFAFSASLAKRRSRANLESLF